MIAAGCVGQWPRKKGKDLNKQNEWEYELINVKAQNLKWVQHEGNKMDKFLEHFAKEIDEYVAEFVDKFFM